MIVNFTAPPSNTQNVLDSFYRGPEELWQLVGPRPVKRRTHPVPTPATNIFNTAPRRTTEPAGIQWINNPRSVSYRNNLNNRHSTNRPAQNPRPITIRTQHPSARPSARRQPTHYRQDTTYNNGYPRNSRRGHLPVKRIIRTVPAPATNTPRSTTPPARIMWVNTRSNTRVRSRHSGPQISPPKKTRKKWFANLLSRWLRKPNIPHNIQLHYNPRPSAPPFIQVPPAHPRPSAPPFTPATPRPTAPPLIQVPPAHPRPSAPPLIPTRTNTSSETMELIEINGTLKKIVNSSLPGNIIDQLLEWLGPEWVGTAQEIFSSTCQTLETYLLEPISNFLGLQTTRGQEALSRRTVRENLSRKTQTSLDDLELAPEAHFEIVQNMIKKEHPEYQHIKTLKLKHREWPDIPPSHFRGLTHHATGIPQAGNMLKYGPKPGHRNVHSGPGFYTAPTISDEIVEEYGIANDISDLGFAVIHYAHYDIGNSTDQYIRKLKGRLGTRAKTDFIITNDNNSILVPWAITLHNKTEAEQVSAKTVISSALSKSKATFQDHFPIALIETLPSTEYKLPTTVRIISLWKESQGNFDKFLAKVEELPLEQFRTVMQALHKLKLTEQENKLMKRTETYYYTFGQSTFV